MFLCAISHLQATVDGDNRSLVIDRYDVDVNSGWQAVFPYLCLIGYDGEVVPQRLTAVMNVGDVLTFDLNTPMLEGKKQTNKKKHEVDIN